MSPEVPPAMSAKVRENVAARWPYVVGLFSVAIGAFGFLYAPISGIAYVSLPGVAFAAYYGFASHSPARAAVAASAIALFGGVIVGVAAVFAFVGDNFFAQEWTAMLALFGLPILGLVIGMPALTFACVCPGHRPARSARGN